MEQYLYVSGTVEEINIGKSKTQVVVIALIPQEPAENFVFL
jgi:hypothetical protein